MPDIKKIEMDEKGIKTKNGSNVLGIQIKCRDHKWQRTIHIKDGIGCSKCYGNNILKDNNK